MIVVGAGPVGLAAAIDLAQRRVPVVLLDDDDTLSTGSRAICFAKRTLEIFDRLGDGAALAGHAQPVKPVLVVPRGHAQPVPGVDVLEDADGLAAQRYDARPGTFYLLRPDQHVCARLRTLDPRAICAA